MGSEKEVGSKQRRLGARINLCCCPPGGEDAETPADAADCCGPLTVNISVTPTKGCCDDSAECCPTEEKE